MIPEFNEAGLLPEGIHWAFPHEIQERYAWNVHRQKLVTGMEKALRALRLAGCLILYLDGSFITSKQHPNDYDACWESNGVDFAALDPVFFDFRNRRAAQKAKYYGEFFPAHATAEITSPFRTFFNFFQTDKETGNKKGIIGINLARIV